MQRKERRRKENHDLENVTVQSQCEYFNERTKQAAAAPESSVMGVSCVGVDPVLD